MSNVTILQFSEEISRQRLIAADLIAQSEAAKQKVERYTRCFGDMEALIASLNGAKRHGYRIRFRALQSELKAAVEELTILEQQLCELKRWLAKQAATNGASAAMPQSANVARQDSESLLERSPEVGQV